MSNAITNACRCLPLPAAKKAVLLCLADRAHDDGKTWPSLAVICEHTSFRRTAVIEALKWLERHRFIRIERVTGRGNVYWVDVDRVREEAARRSEEATPVRRPTSLAAVSYCAPVREPEPTGPADAPAPVCAPEGTGSASVLKAYIRNGNETETDIPVQGVNWDAISCPGLWQELQLRRPDLTRDWTGLRSNVEIQFQRFPRLMKFAIALTTADRTMKEFPGLVQIADVVRAKIGHSRSASAAGLS